MLELHPTLGKNDRGEFMRWLVFYRYTIGAPRQSVGHYQIKSAAGAGGEYLNYLTLPWIFRGKPDIQTFDAMAALGVLADKPDPWPNWAAYRVLLPDDWRVMEWCLSTDVHEAAICAAIQRKESIR